MRSAPAGRAAADPPARIVRPVARRSRASRSPWRGKKRWRWSVPRALARRQFSNCCCGFTTHNTEPCGLRRARAAQHARIQHRARSSPGRAAGSPGCAEWRGQSQGADVARPRGVRPSRRERWRTHAAVKAVFMPGWARSSSTRSTRRAAHAQPIGGVSKERSIRLGTRAR
jgi:hypothetical protein